MKKIEENFNKYSTADIIQCSTEKTANEIIEYYLRKERLRAVFYDDDEDELLKYDEVKALDKALTQMGINGGVTQFIVDMRDVATRILGEKELTAVRFSQLANIIQNEKRIGKLLYICKRLLADDTSLILEEYEKENERETLRML